MNRIDPEEKMGEEAKSGKGRRPGRSIGAGVGTALDAAARKRDEPDEP